MVDPFDVLKCVYAVVTFAYKRGPTHRLDKTDKHLSNVLDVIEDHRDYKPDQEVKDLLEEYDSLRVLVQDTREEYTSRPVLLKITPKVMSDVRNLKKKSKVLLTSAKRSSDAAKRRALLQPTTVTGDVNSGHQETIGSSDLSSIPEGTDAPVVTLSPGGVYIERAVTLAVHDQGINIVNSRHNEETPHLMRTMQFTTTLGTLEQCCPGIINQIYAPVGSAIVDESPLVINVTAVVFADILRQLAAGAAREGIVDEDYPMGDTTGVTV